MIDSWAPLMIASGGCMGGNLIPRLHLLIATAHILAPNDVISRRWQISFRRHSGFIFHRDLKSQVSNGKKQVEPDDGDGGDGGGGGDDDEIDSPLMLSTATSVVSLQTFVAKIVMFFKYFPM